jgi:hypothetical protein
MDNPLPFFEQTGVIQAEIPVGPGIPLGVQQVSNWQIGIGGAFGAWGECYDNAALPALIERRLGEPLRKADIIDLASLGFVYRHHIAELTPEEHLEVELAVGETLLRKAAQACGWDLAEVEGVLIGTSGPVSDDYTLQIAQRAGIPDTAWKVSMHKACDGSVGSLHMALNPDLELYKELRVNLARELEGKKVLVGGIEGLSRFVEYSRDANALQLFGNGAGVIGVVPGGSMQLITGMTHEVFDVDGVLAVHMYYPHSRRRRSGLTNVETQFAGANHIRVAGLMNEPHNGRPVVMAGPMGMVKLFVRSGVQVVTQVYQAYRERMESNMIAFLRQLPAMQPGDHILVDGFGAGTYYDVLAAAIGE